MMRAVFAASLSVGLVGFMLIALEAIELEMPPGPDLVLLLASAGASIGLAYAIGWTGGWVARRR